jgi:hypothetical protein
MLWLVIDNGDTFEGTIAMFRDCFFDNAYVNTIQDWCEENDMKLEIQVKTKEEIEARIREIKESKV